VKVGDRRFPRWIVKDAENRYWRAEGRWSADASGALLFCRDLDATKQKNRYCLGGDPADTFTATVVVTAHPPTLVAQGDCRFVKRHREFCIGGPAGKGGFTARNRP